MNKPFLFKYVMVSPFDWDFLVFFIKTNKIYTVYNNVQHNVIID